MSSRLLAVSILAFTIGCRDSQTVTGPAALAVKPLAPTASNPVMVASSPATFSVLPGEEAAPAAVRILLSRDWTPVSGTRVTFAYSDGATKSVVTGADGYARTDKWQLDYTKSSDSVIATADGISGAAKFTALILHKETVAVYDLKLIGGQSLPITYSGGNTSWAVTGGHYTLFSDGTYVFGYEIDGKPRWNVPLPFIRRESSIEFYLTPAAAPQSQFYANNGYLFSTGTLTSSGMSVVYTDPVDFEDEVYVKR